MPILARCERVKPELSTVVKIHLCPIKEPLRNESRVDRGPSAAKPIQWAPPGSTEPARATRCRYRSRGTTKRCKRTSYSYTPVEHILRVEPASSRTTIRGPGRAASRSRTASWRCTSTARRKTCQFPSKPHRNTNPPALQEPSSTASSMRDRK